ncbi:MAG TPA: four helix bundle protein [Chitinophagaceae bacterium]|nr:four helix bundle protein [Chitinophagaceae bacterium]
MKQENLILDKSYKFGLRIVKLYLHLKKKKIDNGLCSQILRSGTSVGANIEEAVGGSSRKDFINKMQVSYKEARETRYWLRLLMDSELLEKKLANSFITDCEEILRILTTILKSSKGGTA